MYDAIDDPYTYANSSVLINKLNLRRQSELSAFEAEITSARADEPLPQGDLDFPHFCAIHYHLFQDVYAWAGQPRSLRIFKQGNPFCFPEHIETQAAKLFKKLATQHHLIDLSGDAFATAGAHFRDPCFPRRQRTGAAYILCVADRECRTSARFFVS